MAGSLEFIKSASGSGVSSLSVTNCFSDKYDVYKIVANNFQPTVTGNAASRFIDSGDSVISATEYDFAALNLKSNTTFAQSRQTNQTYIFPHQYSDASFTYGSNFVMYVFNPNDTGSYTFLIHQSDGYDTGAGLLSRKGIGVHKVAEQITGINLFNINGGNITMDILVYGVK